MDEIPIRFVTTGGTIDKVYFDAKSRFEVGDSTLDELFAQAKVTFAYVIETVCKKDSLDLTDADREAIRAVVARAPESRVVVTHGTDTMVETARVLEGIAGKTIVLTGALSPARFHESDAIFNVGMAVAAAQTLPAGVYLAMSGRIFDPRRVRKNREADRFEEFG
jgi:L-asparaginase